MFIVIEGADYSGKTAQIARLTKRLKAVSGREVLQLEFPSDSTAGYAARKCIKARWQEVSDDPLFQPIVVQGQMTVDRYSKADAIRACIRMGGIVVVGRWKPSGVIYGEADGLDPGWILASQSSLPDADLHILLDVPLATIEERMHFRSLGRDRFENPTFQARVVAGYRRMWIEGEHRECYNGKWIAIDGTKSQEEVHEAIWSTVVANAVP